MGNLVTEGVIATRWGGNNQHAQSILTVPVSAAVGAFTLCSSAFIDNSRVNDAGRKTSAVAAPLHFCNSLVAAVARV